MVNEAVSFEAGPAHVREFAALVLTTLGRVVLATDWLAAAGIESRQGAIVG